MSRASSFAPAQSARTEADIAITALLRSLRARWTRDRRYPL
jgi:hypothetical protein